MLAPALRASGGFAIRQDRLQRGPVPNIDLLTAAHLSQEVRSHILHLRSALRAALFLAIPCRFSFQIPVVGVFYLMQERLLLRLILVNIHFCNYLETQSVLQ